MSTTLRHPRKPLRRLPNGQLPPRLPERVLTTAVLLVCCAAVVVPFIAIVSTSVAPPAQVERNGGLVLWPEGFNLNAYRSVLSGGVVLRALLVSLGVTLVGTVLSLVVSAMMAYGLSRPGTVAHRPILLILLFSLLFSPGLIPLYLTVKQLGLINSWWALIIPSLVSGFNVIVLRSFFMGIPTSLYESARIDGAGDFAIFWRIVVPLSKPVLAVIGLFYAVGYWNAFFGALIYLQDQTKWPLALVLRTYVINNTAMAQGDLGAAEAMSPQPSLQMAMLVIAVLPILLLYPFLQRHFTAGVLTGAVKG